MRREIAFLTAVLVSLGGAAVGDERSRESDLEALRRQIGWLEERLLAVSEESDGAHGELAQVELDLELQTRRAREAETAHQLAAGELSRAQQRLDELELASAAARAELRRALTTLYRLGRQGYLRLLLSGGPSSGLLPGIRLLRYLTRRDAAAIEAYRSTARLLATQRLDLLRQQALLAEWAREEASRERTLAAARRRAEGVVARLERERSNLTRARSDLTDKEERLASFLEYLSRQAAVALDGTPIQQFRGVLDWPVEGRVTVGFGPRLDRRYGTRVPHDGLEIETEPGSAVHAVFAGTVVYASEFPGFGPTVVVQHPGRVFSLYSGLSALRTAHGDVLSLGQIVGRASARVYFEVRVESEPQDPATWLR